MPFRFQLSPLNAVALLIAAAMCVPIAAVVLNLMAPASPAWPHLASTVLPRYAVNTALLEETPFKAFLAMFAVSLSMPSA